MVFAAADEFQRACLERLTKTAEKRKIKNSQLQQLLSKHGATRELSSAFWPLLVYKWSHHGKFVRISGWGLRGMGRGGGGRERQKRGREARGKGIRLRRWKQNSGVCRTSTQTYKVVSSFRAFMDSWKCCTAVILHIWGEKYVWRSHLQLEPFITVLKEIADMSFLFLLLYTADIFPGTFLRNLSTLPVQPHKDKQ